jgi:hypothetical protein
LASINPVTDALWELIFDMNTAHSVMARAKRVRALLALAPGLVLTHHALAHHSYAAFDMNQTLELQGTVVEFQWTNPHSWLIMVVPDASGNAVRWNLEMGPPGDLVRTGWKRNCLKPGDKVRVVLHPLRTKAIGGELVKVTAPDGHVYGQRIFAPETAGAQSK